MYTCLEYTLFVKTHNTVVRGRGGGHDCGPMTSTMSVKMRVKLMVHQFDAAIDAAPSLEAGVRQGPAQDMSCVRHIDPASCGGCVTGSCSTTWPQLKGLPRLWTRCRSQLH